MDETGLIARIRQTKEIKMKDLYKRKFSISKKVGLKDQAEIGLTSQQYHAFLYVVSRNYSQKHFSNSTEAFKWFYKQVSDKFPEASQSFKFVMCNKIANSII